VNKKIDRDEKHIPCCGQYINQGFATFVHSIFKGILEPSGRLKM